MPIDLAIATTHATTLTELQVCTTAEISALALTCTPEHAREILKSLVLRGHVRALLLPGLGNTVVYQPTGKVHPTKTNLPAFLRATATNSARLRGLLRGYVCFASHPNLRYMPASQQLQLMRRYGVQSRGYAPAIVGLNNLHANIFVPFVPNACEIAHAIEIATLRWLPMLTEGNATLHFVAARQHAIAVQLVLSSIEGNQIETSSQQLKEVRRQIAEDNSGLAAIRLANKVRELETAIAQQVTNQPTLQWLAKRIVSAEL
jgi:hypothetical protein